MPDPTTLLAAADRLADRFRSMPHGRLAALAPSGLTLARQLARQAQKMEGGPVREDLPEVGIFAVGDQIALAAHDLAAALRDAARREADDAELDGAEAGGAGAGGAGAEQVLADSLAAVRAVAALQG